jgi:hypothetical protein
MMLERLSDPAFPALAALGPTDLARITSVPDARLLRLRYQPGARAILHVALGAGDQSSEGAIWFFAGDKAKKLARREDGARLDAPTQALFQVFPYDHRIPALAQFVGQAMALAPALIGGPAAGPPLLMRYRPGLSATFRWTRQDERVKQTPDGDMRALALASCQLTEALMGKQLAIARVAGILPELGLIAYEAAAGQPLDTLLCNDRDQNIGKEIAQVIGALRLLWSQTIVPPRVLTRHDHLRRAAQAAQIISLADAEVGLHAADMLAGLHTTPAPVRLCPIHADMKLEHAFLSGRTTTLIDMESLSLGDPDYDLAKLEARLVMARTLATLSTAGTEAGIAEIRRHTGQHYPWFLTCARLQCAKFFAQRMDPATVPAMRRVLMPC